MDMDGLYEKYASTHAGVKDAQSEALVARRDILPHLPPETPEDSQILDIGCGQGQLVQAMIDAGYRQARGVDISPEQVELAHRNGILSVECGDYRTVLTSQSWSAVVATDLVEHLTKDQVLELFSLVRVALGASGVFVVRSPNATSPFGGNYQFGDFTHQTFLTPRSFAQVARNSGFSQVDAYACKPIVHGAKSRARSVIWAAGAGVMRLLLAAETGETDHIVTQNFVGVASASK